jgi:hypothetical protein
VKTGLYAYARASLLNNVGRAPFFISLNGSDVILKITAYRQVSFGDLQVSLCELI